MILEPEDETMLEASLSNLKHSTTRAFGQDRTKRATGVRISNYQVVPSAPNKSLLFKARVPGKDGNYDVQIRFTNVKFGTELQPGFIALNGMDGNEYFVKQFTASQAQARVKCSCLDFYYRFSVWNHKKKSLEGDAPVPYIKKTDSAPINPTQADGSCKHILSFVEFLKKERVIR